MGSSPDAIAIVGQALSGTMGGASGLYSEGNALAATSNASGAEIRSQTLTTSAGSWPGWGRGAPELVSIIASTTSSAGAPNHTNGTGIAVYAIGSNVAYDDGLVFGSVGAWSGGIIHSTIRDLTDSQYSLDIEGAHGYSIQDLSSSTRAISLDGSYQIGIYFGGSFSGNLLNGPNFYVTNNGNVGTNLLQSATGGLIVIGFVPTLPLLVT